MPIDVFLNIALSKYYNKPNRIGKTGDFITSSEISSIFGEIIACFIMDFILQNNIKNAKIVEIGSGNGKLLNDIYNTIKSLKLLNKVSEFISIEKSEAMRNLQKEILPKQIIFLNNIDELEISDPIIIISNELFDAMPIKQYVFKKEKWYELLVENNNKIIHSLDYSNIKMDAREGNILELPVAGLDLFEQMAKKVKQSGGMMLTIDYGFKEHCFGSTLQALKKHKKVNFLDDIGNCDITHLVQFSFFEKIAKSIGLTSTITIQKDFLVQNGILIRSQNQNMEVKSAVNRLIDNSDGEMGGFLVMINKCDL